MQAARGPAGVAEGTWHATSARTVTWVNLAFSWAALMRLSCAFAAQDWLFPLPPDDQENFYVFFCIFRH